MNNSGSISIFSILISSLALSFIMLLIIKAEANLENMKDRSFIYLCMKEFQSKTTPYLKEMKRLNKVIDLANKAKLLAYTTFRPIAVETADAIKKISILKQEIATKKNQIIRLELIRKKCLLPHLSPYLQRGLILQRSPLGLALLRTNTWNVFAKRKNINLIGSFDFNDGIKFKTQEGLLWPK